jgi:hypothetical protein
VITPSLPTFSIASAMISPIVESLLAEIVPTWAIKVLAGMLMGSHEQGAKGFENRG